MLKETDTELLSRLKQMQEDDGCLTSEAISRLAEQLEVSESQLYGVATFYSLLNTDRAAKHTIHICGSISCHLSRADEVLRAAESSLGIRAGQITGDGMFRLEAAGCLGACGSGPAALIDGRLHTHINVETLTGLIDALKEDRVLSGVRDQSTAPVSFADVPVLVDTPTPNPALDDLTPEEIIAVVEASGLRGRGGAAFPTGRKWRLCAETAAATKYVVCNADESEPGTFKDRWLLVRRPDLVVLGMLLAGLAVGARQGYVYVRGEYGDLLEGIETAVRRICCDSFNIKILSGAGAYICGEETALLESIEGRRGVPRLRPPYPPVSGLFGCPTVINNVETLANVPFILGSGSEWYRRQGTPESPGTKLFCVSGDVAHPGIFEYPLGVSLSDVLDRAGARELKAALVGGASGRLVGVGGFDRRLCYEDLSPGSGAIIAIGRDRSIRDVAANLMDFFEDESCGECSICRIGTARATQLLKGKLSVERPRPDVLLSLVRALQDGARCGLGQAASIALSDAVKLFPEEFV